MITTFNVRCQQCGAPLQVADNIRFLTCGYCKAELQVVRSESVVHTELLEQVESHEIRVNTALRAVELQVELERLEREWDRWQDANVSRDKRGRKAIPQDLKLSLPPNQVIGMGLFVGVLIQALCYVLEASAQAHFSLGLICAFVVIISVRAYQVAEKYSAEHTAYEQKKHALLAELDNLRLHSPQKTLTSL